MNNKTQPQRKRARRSNKTKKINNNNRAVTVPASVSSVLQPSHYSITSSGGGSQIRVTGRDILGLLTYSGGGSEIWGVFDLNPACWVNSRLSLVAKTYEKYRYDHIVLHFIPSTGTSTSGFVGVYVEPEVYDPIVNSVTQVLTHHNATAGPVWCPAKVAFSRAPSDQTTYLCTDKSGIERGLMTQAKAAVISNTGSSSLGILAIEYDITFMYPELEYGFAGEQYALSSAALTAAANGVIATVPVWSSIGVKVVELVLGNPILGVFVNNASNIYDFVTGSLIYSAWDGTSWRLYPDIASALAKNGPLSSVAAIAGLGYTYFVRKLVSGYS